MKCGGHRERTARPNGPGGAPLDRNPGELTIYREGGNGKVAGSEGFPKSSVELKLHAGRFRQVIPERVKDRPILWARIESDEVPNEVVPRPTLSGDGCVGSSHRRGELLGAGPFTVSLFNTLRIARLH